MRFFDKLSLAWQVLRKFDSVDAIVSKIVELESVVGRLANMESKLSVSDSLLSLAERIEKLDALVERIESSQANAAMVVRPTDPSKREVPNEAVNEWNRLKLLAKFVSLSEQATEIEKEWQRIQQDEHDFFLAFQTNPDEDSKINYIFKKGIAEGIKWCVNRFS